MFKDHVCEGKEEEMCEEPEDPGDDYGDVRPEEPDGYGYEEECEDPYRGYVEPTPEEIARD